MSQNIILAVIASASNLIKRKLAERNGINEADISSVVVFCVWGRKQTKRGAAISINPNLWQF